MTENQGDQRDLIEALQRFADKADQVLSLNSGNNSNTINMGSGERGIWICVCISMVTTAAVAVGSVWMSREFNRYDIALSERKEESDRAQTYLSSIYGRMPQWMREEVEKEASAKLEAKGNKNAE